MEAEAVHVNGATKSRFVVVEVEVKRIIEDDNNQLTKRIIQVTRVNTGEKGDYFTGDVDEALTLTQFQVGFWPDDASIPENPHLLYGILQEATRVLQNQLQASDSKGSPTKVVVHCLDACSKSGLFVACCNLVLLMDAEQLVHVPHCVMNVRDSIADAVVDERQMKLIFEIAKLHLENYQVYDECSL